MDKYNSEIWKDVRGYEGIYMVSNLGRVKSCKRKIIMRQKLNKGYLMVNLYKNSKLKTVHIHRLVAYAFVENTFKKPQVNHVDEDKLNNRSDNLEWVTPGENVNWGTRNKRTYKPVAQINKKTNCIIDTFASLTEASRITGLFMSEISRCCSYKAKTTGGYKFKFL